MRRQINWLAAVLSVVMAMGGLFVAAPAQADDPIVQDGPVNYAGPDACPKEGVTDCATVAGDLEVQQTGTSNEAECAGDNCVIVQSGPRTAQNTADCSNTSTAGDSTQTCDVTQTGGTNSITANFTANPEALPVTVATVEQTSSQNFLTTQNGDTNTLTVNGTITQTANSILDATTPVLHMQGTSQRAVNTMRGYEGGDAPAAVKNTADFDLVRTQTSRAQGANPEQYQDTTADFGLGSVRLVAKSAGENDIEIDGMDTKSQTAVSLDSGEVIQTQGRDNGGWLVDLSGTDSATRSAAADVDIGNPAPGSTDGLVKDWSQTASGGPFGAPSTKVQEQIDDIRIPLLGRSPQDVLINAYNKLRTDAGGHEVCNASSEGHADNSASGRVTCDLNAGGNAAFKSIPWNAVTWKVDINCERNNDKNCTSTTTPVFRKEVEIQISGTDKKSGVIPVAILSRPNYNDGNPSTVDDARTVDPNSVCFGRDPFSDPRQCDSTLNSKGTLKDVNGDGWIDLMLHYEAAETKIVDSDTNACLVGRTYERFGGEDVEGCALLHKR